MRDWRNDGNGCVWKERSLVPELPIETLQRVAEALNESGLDYAIIGGVAVSLMAVPRFTVDVDAVLWNADEKVAELLDVLGKHGLMSRTQDPFGFARQYRMIVLSDPEGIPVDLTLGALPFEFSAIANSRQIDLNGLSVPIAPPDALIVMKAVASRPKDLEDIRSLLSTNPDLDREAIREQVAAFAEILEQPELLDRLALLLNER